MASFAQLGLHPALVDACQSLCITTPTEIQQKSIPPALKGKDVVGIAKTGSGKTACYCLPIIQRAIADPYSVLSLVLLPTRELAIQVSEQFSAFCSSVGMGNRISLVIGGADWLSQSRALTSGPYFVVATPGRLRQHMEQDDVRRRFQKLAMLVLDEADRLLTSTLIPDVTELERSIRSASRGRQTLLFSATTSPEVTAFIDKLGDEKKATNSVASEESLRPAVVNVNEAESPVEQLQQQYLFVPHRHRLVYLVYLLMTSLKDLQGIIFTPTCTTCQVVTSTLELLGYSVTCLHSLLNHRRRVAHLAKFRSEVSRVLVATDVAARGLDIPTAAFVVNFGFPRSFEDYVHRVGRTARAGRQGLAISLIGENDDVDKIHEVESRMSISLEEHTIDEDAPLKLLNAVTKRQHKACVRLSELGFFDKAEVLKKQRRRVLGRRKIDKKKKWTKRLTTQENE